MSTAYNLDEFKASELFVVRTNTDAVEHQRQTCGQTKKISSKQPYKDNASLTSTDDCTFTVDTQAGVSRHTNTQLQTLKTHTFQWKESSTVQPLCFFLFLLWSLFGEEAKNSIMHFLLTEALHI